MKIQRQADFKSMNATVQEIVVRAAEAAEKAAAVEAEGRFVTKIKLSLAACGLRRGQGSTQKAPQSKLATLLPLNRRASSQTSKVCSTILSMLRRRSIRGPFRSAPLRSST